MSDLIASESAYIYTGSTCCARFIELADAEGLLSLRTDPVLSKYISKVDSDVDVQKEWIEAYKMREAAGKEFYFAIIENKKFIGTTRIYNIDFPNRVFTGGSWVIRSDGNSLAAVEALLATYSFAFDGLGMDTDVFDVRKENKAVLAFHKNSGAKIIGESEMDFFEIRTARGFDKYLEKIHKIVPVHRFSKGSVTRILKNKGIPYLCEG